MKNNISLLKGNLKSMINSNRFRLIILLLICLNIYGVIYVSYAQSYVNGLLYTMIAPYYLIGLLAVLFVNTLYTFDAFEQNDLLIIRFQSRKQYLKELLKLAICSNAILFLINLLIVMIGLNLIVGGNFQTEPFLNYSFSNGWYLLFYLFRLFLLMTIITIFNILILKLTNSKIAIVINIIFWLSFLLIPYSLRATVSSVAQMYWPICEYMRLHQYDSFLLEIVCSTIYFSVLTSIAFFLFHLTYKKMKQVGI